MTFFSMFLANTFAALKSLGAQTKPDIDPSPAIWLAPATALLSDFVWPWSAGGAEKNAVAAAAIPRTLTIHESSFIGEAPSTGCPG
jgi:hypothetical protein